MPRKKVNLIKERFSEVTNRMIPIGTIGELLATRKSKEPGRVTDALVKFKGFSCPVSLDIDDISWEGKK